MKSHQLWNSFKVAVLLLACSTASIAQRSDMSDGYSEYEKKRFRNAESAYREAMRKDPALDEAKHNLGNALYRQGKFEEASNAYVDASRSSKEPVKSSAFYNLGNSLMKAEKYEEAVEAYKQALRTNPSDQDARYNLSYALQKLRRQQQQDKNKDKQKDNKDQQQKQQQQQQDKQDKENKSKNNQSEQKDKSDQENQKNKSAQQPKLSKEEAERILKSMRNDEKNLQKEKAKRFPAGDDRPVKNW
jgi:Ca-activated chloride channel family protein